MSKFYCVYFLYLFIAFNSAGQAKKATVTSKTKTVATSAATNKKAVEKPLAQNTSTERLVQIETNYGTMIAKLYNATPLHRDNFIKLVNEKFYDSLLFHRVIGQFMIQGGDPASRNATPDMLLGNGSAPGERIPAEMNSTFFHKKGALAAARDNNPQKSSSNCQFYIVQGKVQTDEDVSKLQKPGGGYSTAHTEIYKRIGGTPFLDQNYTVFGEVISGLEVIDKIAQQGTGPNNRPLNNVTMKIRLLN